VRHDGTLRRAGSIHVGTAPLPHPVHVEGEALILRHQVSHADLHGVAGLAGDGGARELPVHCHTRGMQVSARVSGHRLSVVPRTVAKPRTMQLDLGSPY
jgi:hypothetical protein